MEKASELRKINLFKDFSQEELNKYATLLRERKYKKKDLVFDTQEEENYILTVAKGKVRVFISYPNGKEFTLTILEPGDVYSSHGQTSIQALEDTTLWTMDVTHYRELMISQPLVAFRMMHIVGQCLKRTIDVIGGLVFKDVNHRLAEFLLTKSLEIGQKSPKGLLLELGLSHEELGNIIGTTRQSVSTFLNELEREGILEKLPQRTYLVKDLPKLKKLKNR